MTVLFAISTSLYNIYIYIYTSQHGKYLKVYEGMYNIIPLLFMNMDLFK